MPAMLAIVALAGLPSGRALADDAQAAAAPATSDMVVFDRDIKSIFEARCYTCHGPDKQKAGLRLDKPECIQAGSEDGPVLTPGKPEDSPLYTRVILPPGSDDIMPAKGDPLTAEQIDLIRRWIIQGAVFAEAESDASTATPSPTPASAPAPTATADSAVKEAPQEKVEETPSLLDTLAKDVPPPSEDALNALRSFGAVAMPLDVHTSLVSVNMQYTGQKANDEALALLAPLAQQITWLNLAGTAVTDAGLSEVAKLPNLTSLHVERTAVGDAGLANLKDVKHLEYLNLYGTKVTDAGLENLQGMQDLKKLYLWNSQATEEGAKKLNSCLTKLTVNLGIKVNTEPAPTAPPPETAADLSLLFDADSCCAKAKAEGKTCDHPCCVEAATKGEVCLKCNPGAKAKLDAQTAPAPESKPEPEKPAPEPPTPAAEPDQPKPEKPAPEAPSDPAAA